MFAAYYIFLLDINGFIWQNANGGEQWDKLIGSLFKGGIHPPMKQISNNKSRIIGVDHDKNVWVGLIGRFYPVIKVNGVQNVESVYINTFVDFDKNHMVNVLSFKSFILHDSNDRCGVWYFEDAIKPVPKLIEGIPEIRKIINNPDFLGLVDYDGFIWTGNPFKKIDKHDLVDAENIFQIKAARPSKKQLLLVITNDHILLTYDIRENKIKTIASLQNYKDSIGYYSAYKNKFIGFISRQDGSITKMVIDLSKEEISPEFEEIPDLENIDQMNIISHVGKYDIIFGFLSVNKDLYIYVQDDNKIHRVVDFPKDLEVTQISTVVNPTKHFRTKSAYMMI